MTTKTVSQPRRNINLSIISEIKKVSVVMDDCSMCWNVLNCRMRELYYIRMYCRQGSIVELPCGNIPTLCLYVRLFFGTATISLHTLICNGHSTKFGCPFFILQNTIQLTTVNSSPSHSTDFLC